MTILKKGNIRLIRGFGYYGVQIRYWFIWWDIRFGDCCPNKFGTYRFNDYQLALEEYMRCLNNDKAYSLKGIDNGF